MMRLGRDCRCEIPLQVEGNDLPLVGNRTTEVMDVATSGSDLARGVLVLVDIG